MARGRDELAAVAGIAAGVTEVPILPGVVETHAETPAGHLRGHHLSGEPLREEGAGLAFECVLNSSREAHEICRSAPEARSRALRVDVPAALDLPTGRERSGNARLEFWPEGLLERGRLHVKRCQDAVGGEVLERSVRRILDQLLQHGVAGSRVGGSETRNAGAPDRVGVGRRTPVETSSVGTGSPRG